MKNRASRVLDAFYATPWALLPGKLAEIDFMLRRAAMADPALVFLPCGDGGFVDSLSVRSQHRALRAAGVSEEQRAEWQAAAAAAKERAQKSTRKGIAVIPIFGTISRRAGLFTDSSGGASIESITADFRAALKSEDVGTIILDIDSPGGSVSGLDELAAEIFAARGQKRIIAIADHFAASAAYYLGSQAHEFVAAPTSEVGSIGVWMLHMDFSRNLDREGITPTFISFGKNKTEGNPFQPMSDETMAHFQSQVDEFGQMFVRAVSRGRGVSMKTVREKFGDGRMFMALEALALGMVDRVATLDETIARALASVQRSGASAETPAPEPKCAVCGGCGCPVAVVNGVPTKIESELCPGCAGSGSAPAAVAPASAPAPESKPDPELKDKMVLLQEAEFRKAAQENARARARALELA